MHTVSAYKMIVAALYGRPGKDHSMAAIYRPISLLSVCFKCLERLLLRCIKPTLENTIVVEQAGFRQGRSTGDQVLALTTFIKNGFQFNQKNWSCLFRPDSCLRYGLAHGSTTEALQNSSTLEMVFPKAQSYLRACLTYT